MTRTVVTLTAVLAVLTLLVSGCNGAGSGGGSSRTAAQVRAERADRKASAAISAAIMGSQRSGVASGFLDISRKDADCVGTGLVDKVGRTRLQHYGLLTKDLHAKHHLAEVRMAATDARKATEVLFGCTDVETMVHHAVAKAGAIPKTMRSCVDKALSGDSLRGVLTKVFQGRQGQAQQQLAGPLSRCALGSSGIG
jgi:hypothetical protein